MGENLILIFLIAGFFALTIFSLAAMLVMHFRDKNRKEAKSLESVIAEFDNGLNTALTEISNLGSIIKKDLETKQKEIEEKYNSVLFLYNLTDEKHKEIIALKENLRIPQAEPMLKRTQASEPNVIQPAATTENFVKEASPELQRVELQETEYKEASPRKKPRIESQKHQAIWELYESGKNTADIARELNLGKGEVKLILDVMLISA